jgi:hypothetical protein
MSRSQRKDMHDLLDDGVGNRVGDPEESGSIDNIE